MFDKNEELITVVDPEYLLESEQTQELNGLITTIVSAPYSKELESAFYIGSRDIDDNNVFWLYKVDKRTKENNNIILNGTYSLFDDLKAYGVIRDKRPSNASALVGINTVLEGSRWQVGNITSTHTGTANWYYVSRLEAFWEYLENWRVEFKPRMTFSQGKITGRYIDVVEKLSADYGKWYEYGDKLLQVTAEQASDSLYTAFIGRGKGEESGNGYGRRIGFEKVVWTTASGKPVNKPLNQDYVEIPSATELYGYSDGKPRMTVVIFEDTEDAAQVLQQTYDYALEECRPKLQLKADVLEDGVSELGETCTIIRDDRGIRYKTRVFKLKRSFLNKKQRTAEFGDEIVQSTAKRNSNTAKEIKKQEDRVIYWLDGLRQELVDSYFNEDGYNYDLTADNEYDLPAGYYSFDRPIDASPTKVIYMGAGKLMIANSKNPDGQWNWTTAIDGDGANLSAVNTGLLKAGRIQSEVDGSFWDLDNGLMDLKGGTLTGTRLEMNLDIGRFTSTGIDGKLVRVENGEVTTTSGTKTGKVNAMGVEIYDSNNGQTTKLYSDGIQFNWYGIIRGITQTSEGLEIKPTTGSGARLNSSLFLTTGSGNDKIAYLQLANPDGGTNSRLEMNGTQLSLRHPNGGSLDIADYAYNGLNGRINSGSFRTTTTDGRGIQMTVSQISALGNNQTIYCIPTGTGEFRVGSGGDTPTLWPVRAQSFIQGSSQDYKTNIEDYTTGALSLLNSMNVVSYDLIKDVESGVINKQVGFISEDNLSISSLDGKGVDIYRTIAVLVKGAQESSEIIYGHETKIAELEKKNKEIKQELKEIKEHLGLV